MSDETQPAPPSIRVEITDDSALHCLKIVFQARPGSTDAERQPLEIYLHTRQAIELNYQLSLAISELHHRDSQLLLNAMARGV
jgi:hypothetical protein